MKTIQITAILYFFFSLLTMGAQVVKDPLLDYYNRKFSKVDLTSARDPESPSPPITPQTQIYCFKADFTGPETKSIFITDQGEYLGAHGKYAWSVYCPVASGGYHLVTDESHFITAGLNGPPYVGYIDQIKGYGVIIGENYSVAAYYIVNGTIQSKAIDQERDHTDAEHYPKYFHDKPIDPQITTYTLAQLAQKYAQ